MPTSLEAAPSRRQEIVEIASQLFYAQGFGATGIKQIIDTVGIAKGTFYTHFDSKESLGLAWLQARHSTWQAWFEKVVTAAGSPGAGLMAAFDFLEAWLKDSDFRGCAFINTMAETPDFNHPMRAEIAAHKADLLVRFQDLAKSHLVDQGRKREDARATGTTLYLLFEAALVEAQNFHETWPVDSARTTARQLLDLAD